MANQCKVFVGSLPPGTKPKELRHLFQNFGIVIGCDVMNRCGFIHMETPAMAEMAILALNGTEFKGQVINVEPGRSKEVNGMGHGPPPNMICDVGEQGGPGPNAFNENFQGGGGHGFRRGGMGGPPGNRGGGMSGAPGNRGGFMAGGPPGNRGGGMGVARGNRRGGMGGPPGNRGGDMAGPPGNRGGRMEGPGNRGGGMGGRGDGMGGQFNRGGGMSNRGGGPPNRGGMSNPFNNRGGSNSGRGGFNTRNQNEGGPMRNNPSFKQRSGPYPPMNGSERTDRQTSSGKFGGNPRGGFNGPHNRNQQQRNNNWGYQNDAGIPPLGNFENMNSMGGGFGGGNMRNPNMGSNLGQDRRGFTLDDAQPPEQQPPHQRQQNFGGNRGPNNFGAPDGAGFVNQNFSDGPPQRGRGGGRGNMGAGRGGGRGMGGRGNFGGGRGGGNANFGPPNDAPNNYNKEFPALQPARGRGGFGGGQRGGFSRNAPNMMPNRRPNM